MCATRAVRLPVCASTIEPVTRVVDSVPFSLAAVAWARPPAHKHYGRRLLILGGVMCLNATVIVRNTYLGFVGDLAFYDMQGATDPLYTGLGSRYVLAYLVPGDIPASTVQTLQVAA